MMAGTSAGNSRVGCCPLAPQLRHKRSCQDQDQHRPRSLSATHGGPGRSEGLSLKDLAPRPDYRGGLHHNPLPNSTFRRRKLQLPTRLEPVISFDSVRGREYLRIIYGHEYTRPVNLLRVKSRGLVAKRSLVMREFALGLEALERFVDQEPLRRVHECAFGVLALESEPVDPRL
jgi:hypothetical protein